MCGKAFKDMQTVMSRGPVPDPQPEPKPEKRTATTSSESLRFVALTSFFAWLRGTAASTRADGEPYVELGGASRDSITHEVNRLTTISDCLADPDLPATPLCPESDPHITHPWYRPLLFEYQPAMSRRAPLTGTFFHIVAASTKLRRDRFLDDEWWDWGNFCAERRSEESLSQLHNLGYDMNQPMRHASGPGRSPIALGRDTGGWVTITSLLEWLKKVHEGRRSLKWAHDLGSNIAKIALAWSMLSGNKIRAAILMECVGDRQCPVCERPFAVRYTNGHSEENQPFLNMSRFATPLTSPIIQMLPGAFHVTTVDAAMSILREGLKPGIMIGRPMGARAGRFDIHCLLMHPQDPRNNQDRIAKTMARSPLGAASIALNLQQCGHLFRWEASSGNLLSMHAISPISSTQWYSIDAGKSRRLFL